MNEEELLRLKKKVSKAKDKRLELQGELKSEHKKLEKQYDCKDVKEAEKKRDKLESDLESIDKKIEKGVKKIQKILNKEEEE